MSSTLRSPPYKERDPGDLDETADAPSSMPPPPPPRIEKPSADYIEAVRAKDKGTELMPEQNVHDIPEYKAPVVNENYDIGKLNISAFPSVQWAESWRCGFGGVRTICVSAWVVFLVLPALFYFLVRCSRRSALHRRKCSPSLCLPVPSACLTHSLPSSSLMHISGAALASGSRVG